MDLQNQEVVKLFLWVGSIVGAVLVYRKFWRLAKTWLLGTYMFLTQGPRIREELSSMRKAVDTLISEMRPNGGSTMRDSLNRIEQGMALQDQRQKMLMSDMENGILEMNTEGACVWVNRTLTRTAGRSFEELLGRGWVNMIASAEREAVVTEWNDAISGQREFDFEFTIVVPTGGARIKVIARSLLMRTAMGKVLGYMLSVRKVE